MNYTNDLSLPAPFVRAVMNDPYSKGDADYSATGLIKPAREAALSWAFDAVLTVDVSECLNRLDGQLSHHLLELAGVEDDGAVILEERLFAEIDGVRISGAMDCAVLLPTGAIYDYKKTSVWKVMRGVSAEWEAQLNIYNWLSAENERAAVTSLNIIAWLRDWTIGQARREREGGKYPQRQVVVLPVTIWPMERTVAYVRERIAAHRAAEAAIRVVDGEVVIDETALALCSDEERWVRDVKWAVMRRGQKNAVRGGTYTTRAEAEHHVNGNAELYVEKRGGEPTRCLDWCLVGRAGRCLQWNAQLSQPTAGGNSGDPVDESAFA